jgi:small subunit ribosomal protein S8
MRHDLLADMFCTIKNAESLGKTDCVVPASNLIKNVLAVMESNKYVGGLEYVDEGRGGRITVKLIRKINDTGVIKPRFSVGAKEFTKYEKRFLPAVGRGILLVSTPKGVMDQNRAREEKTGGKLLGYVY